MPEHAKKHVYRRHAFGKWHVSCTPERTKRRAYRRHAFGKWHVSCIPKYAKQYAYRRHAFGKWHIACMPEPTKRRAYQIMKEYRSCHAPVFRALSLPEIPEYGSSVTMRKFNYE